MANVIIRSFPVVDEDQDPVPYNENNNSYGVVFNPKNKPLRQSRLHNLSVTCDVNNAGSDIIQVQFRLVLLNYDEYDFLEHGEDHEIKYVRQVRQGNPVYLPFQLRNLQPMSNISNARFTIFARHSVAGSPVSRRSFQIEPR